MKQDHIVAYYYGIDRTTFRVERVALTREGAWVSYQKGRVDRHPLQGRSPDIECAIVFNLSNVRSIPASAVLEDSEKRVRVELEALAEQMKKVAAKA